MHSTPMVYNPYTLTCTAAASNQYQQAPTLSHNSLLAVTILTKSSQIEPTPYTVEGIQKLLSIN